MEQRNTLIRELVFLLEKGNAHASFEDAIAGVPAELRSVRPDTLPYSIWELAEHIRITQWDIVEFCLSDKHQSPKWPDEYWPGAKEKISDEDWEKTGQQVTKDRERFVALLQAKEADLYTPFAHGDGQNLLREALLIADHTAYHTGQILVVRRLLGCWD
ncbi:DinB family protein [Taibaiella koreensis]|uniref:DinB family protein n=1 Tax=Taibaiella koreensis TaxID=1268548 RepID=UPI000E599C92|nr:DinB family protein [Taibaiella koreensis]